MAISKVKYNNLIMINNQMASLGGIGLYSRHLTDDDVSNIGVATRHVVMLIVYMHKLYIFISVL